MHTSFSASTLRWRIPVSCVVVNGQMLHLVALACGARNGASLSLKSILLWACHVVF